MNKESRLPRLQKLAGNLAMLCLFLAVISLIDALLGGMKGRQSTVDLIPDSTFAISGPMPPKTEALSGFVIEGEPQDGSVRLLPSDIFSGYWLGGSMWRGSIVVEPFAGPGSYIISVKDQFGEKQNPALVFSVRVWADQAELNAHSPSRLTRWSGHSPFVFVIAFALCGAVMGVASFCFGRSWRRYLAIRHCGEIHMLKRLESRDVEIQCEILGMTRRVNPGDRATVYRPLGEALDYATVISLEKNVIILHLDDPTVKVPYQVRLGDVVCLNSEENGDAGKN